MITSKKNKYAVLGAGSWGTALGYLAANATSNCTIFTDKPELVEEINNSHTNSKYAGTKILPSSIQASTYFEELKNYDRVIIAYPLDGLLDAYEIIQRFATRQTISIIATKGITPEGKMPSELFSSMMPLNKYLLLSGPSFAKDVMRNKSTFVDLSSTDEELAKEISEELSLSWFHCKPSNDIVTAQISSAYKNVISIASGVIKALNLGENAIAALFAIGLKEIAALSTYLGGQAKNVTSLSAAGDLFLTMSSLSSRNTKFGYEFAISNERNNFVPNLTYLVEGLSTLEGLEKIIISTGLNLAIPKNVSAMIELQISPEQAIKNILG